ncbi:insulin growth factor-like family member 3 [Trichosurus vulpecula]|uniref:insulin growth factor-like family member 3 n=1 Tax=Trichosurus vulpecula TaxID=9337 RepID=UPI00186AE3B7|nr:insulin growth factor-like family member 3 [Trichosurus vulpecula]
MASRHYIMAIIVSIVIMVILSSSGAPVTPPNPQAFMCQPWLLCGIVAYNPQDSQCCEDGSVQSLPLKCGHEDQFDPCSQYCCPNSVKNTFTVINKTREGTERSDCKMVSSN